MMLKQAKLPVSLSISHFASLLQKLQVFFDSTHEQPVLQREATAFYRYFLHFQSKQKFVYTHLSSSQLWPLLILPQRQSPQPQSTYKGRALQPQHVWCSFRHTSAQQLHRTSKLLSFCCLQEMEKSLTLSSQARSLWFTYHEHPGKLQETSKISSGTTGNFFFNLKLPTIPSTLTKARKVLKIPFYDNGAS